jgi:hypothetical protein
VIIFIVVIVFVYYISFIFYINVVYDMRHGVIVLQTIKN